MINIKKYSKVFWKSGLSVTDQLVFSGGNFVLNIFLIRLMTPSEYGSFAIAFAFLILISGFFNVIVFEPLSVVGHTQYSGNMNGYLSAVIRMQVAFSFLSTIILIVILSSLYALKAVGGGILLALFGASLSAPFVLFHWLLRRICYLEGDAHIALPGSFMYTVFLLTGLFFIRHFNFVSPFKAFMIMLLASVVSSIFLWRVLLPRTTKKNFLTHNIPVLSILSDHWRYGKWLSGAAVTYWLCGDFYLILIGIFMGGSQAGVYSAMGNLMAPFLQTMNGLSLLLVPWFARQRVSQGVSYVWRNLGKLIFFSVLLSIIYSTFVLINGKFLVKVFYRNNYFDNFIWLLPFLAIIVTLTALKQSLGIIVRVIEKPGALFWATLGSSLFAITAGILFIYKWKFYGVVAGISIGILLECVVMMHCISRERLSV